MDLKKIDKKISSFKIQKQIKKLAKKINFDYQGKKIVFLVTLTGAVNFAYDLAKRIKIPVEFEFINATSYSSNNTRNKDVKIEYFATIDLKNKDVILIEDIVETGKTLKVMLDFFNKKNVNSIALATIFSLKKIDDIKHYNLFDKKPSGFLVGYGFDDNEYNRNLTYIGIIK